MKTQTFLVLALALGGCAVGGPNDGEPCEQDSECDSEHCVGGACAGDGPKCAPF